MSTNSSLTPRLRKTSPKQKPGKKHQVPRKPNKDFPLTPTCQGYWTKKIRGKVHRFGRWGRIVDGKMEILPGDEWWEPALKLFNAQSADLQAGRTPKAPAANQAMTLKVLVNLFLNDKLAAVNSGRRSKRTLDELTASGKRLCEWLGKDAAIETIGPDEFRTVMAEIEKTRKAPSSIGNEITRIKSFFNYAVGEGHLHGPINYGTRFVKPDRDTHRKHRAKQDKKLFTAEEIQRLVKKATPDLKAAILLGINCGMGNTDVAELQFKHLDLAGGWHDMARVKTGVQRRCPLWPETVKAIKAASTNRPTATDNLVLLATNGKPFVRLGAKSRTDDVANEFSSLLKTLKINGRKGLGFYSLRHTFATIALGARDRDAVKAIMGHTEADILSHYDETGPSDQRRLDVVNFVRQWLFGKKGGAK